VKRKRGGKIQRKKERLAFGPREEKEYACSWAGEHPCKKGFGKEKGGVQVTTVQFRSEKKIGTAIPWYFLSYRKRGNKHINILGGQRDLERKKVRGGRNTEHGGRKKY